MTQNIDKRNMKDEQWLEFRRKGVGSSDIGAILGLSKYKTSYEVFADKRGLIPPFEGNNATKWGLILEPAMHQLFLEAHPECTVKMDNKIRVHKKYPWAMANLDRVIKSTARKGVGILELKTTTSYVQNTWENGIPLEYWAQVQWQLFVTGYTWAILFVGILDQRDTYELVVERDEAFIEKMVAKAENFWMVVEGGVWLGEITATDAEKLRPVLGKEVEVDGDTWGAMAQEKEGLEKEKTEIEGRIDKIKDQFKAAMGDAEYMRHVTSGAVLATFIGKERAGHVVEPKFVRTLLIKKESKKKGDKNNV